jgi:hypothetical protein
MMKLACCGLDCNKCDLRPKDCDGCHAESDHLWHADCKIRLCCKLERKLDNCSLCKDFPCPTIRAFGSDKWAHHRAAFQRLEKMRGERSGT